MFRDLPSHRLALTQGLSTKFEPSATAGVFLQQADNVDGFDEFRTLGKIPGSTRINGSATDPVKSVHYFEFFDYDRQQKRRLLAATSSGANPSLRQIDLDTGVVSLLALLDAAEPMFTAEMNFRLHLSSPNQGKGANVPTGGVKYDGTRVTNWGVIAPGLGQNELEAFDNHATWTVALGTAVLSTDSQNAIKGSSVKVSNPSSAGDVAISKNFGGLNIDPEGTGLLRVWAFLPSGAFQALTNSATVPAFTFYFIANGAGFPSAADTLQFDVPLSSLVLGWNLLAFDIASPTSVGGSFNSANVTTIRIHSDFIGGNPALALQFDSLYTLEESAPDAVASAAASTIKIGSYRYRITYVTEYGLESNAGLPGDAVVIAADDVSVIDLSNFPASSDPSVRAIRLYREKDGIGDFRFVTELPNDAAVTYQDTLDQISLSTVTPPLAGDLVLDNSPPVAFSEVTVVDSRVLGVDASNRRTLLISAPNEPEAFALVDQIQFDQAITAVRGHSLGTLIYTNHSVYVLTGSGTLSDPFFVRLLTSDLGANSSRSVIDIRGRHIVVREREIHYVPDPADPWYMSGPIQDQLDTDLLETRVADTFVVHDRKRFRIVFFGVGSEGFNTELWVAQYGTKGFQQITGDGAGTDPLDARVSTWQRIRLPETVTPNCAAIGETNLESPELWVGTEEGFVYRFQDPTADAWAVPGVPGVEAVEAAFRFVPVPLGSASGGRGDPRYLKVNMVAEAGATWTFTIELLSDAGGQVKNSSSFNFTFEPGDTSPIIPIPPQGVRAEWCRITMTNTENITPPRVRSVELYYITRFDFRGQRAS